MKKNFKKITFYSLAAIGALSVLAFASWITIRTINYSQRYAPSPYFEDYSKSNALSLSERTVFSNPPAVLDYADEQGEENLVEGELTQRKIIKNGSLSLLVDGVEESAAKIGQLAEDLGGFVSYSYLYEVSADTKGGTITIRVPADKFKEAFAKARELAQKVEKETVDAQDVTEQFVDLEARLKNLRAVESQYLEIMEKADTVEDILKVTQRLDATRRDIEVLEGQLKYLSEQAEMSTLTVYLTSLAEVEIFGIYWKPLFVVKQSFHNTLLGLKNYADSMIKLFFALPTIGLWLITIGFFVWAGYKLIRLSPRFLKKKH